MITRRQFVFGCLGAVPGGVAYARFVEPRWLNVTRARVELTNPQLIRSVRIVHLSDLHLSDHVPLSFIERAVDTGLRLQPDIVCLTGDFITRRTHQSEEYAAVLGRLAKAAPCFAIAGNHDGGAWVSPMGGYADTGYVEDILRGAGIAFLKNRQVSVSIGEQPLRVAGCGDLWAGEFRPGGWLTGGEDVPTVALSHNPDTKDELLPFRWDLLLCGHTHGGQIALPGFGTPFAPVEDHRYVRGLHAWEGRWLHVSAGVGNLGGVRFGCRPEVNLLTLEPRPAP
jgi:uncharacterized protein